MKKYLITLTVLLVAVVTLTGCGGTKNLTCSNDQQTISMDFKGDKLKKVSMKMAVQEAGSKEAAEEAKKKIDEQMKDQKMDGVTINTSVDGTKVYLEMKFDLDKVDDTTKNTYLSSLVDAKANIDDVRKEAEADGYNCK